METLLGAMEHRLRGRIYLEGICMCLSAVRQSGSLYRRLIIVRVRSNTFITIVCRLELWSEVWRCAKIDREL